MMDFIRNYDPGSDEYTRRIRFIGHDSNSNELARKILEIGEIKIHDPKTTSGQVRLLTTPLGIVNGKTERYVLSFFRVRWMTIFLFVQVVWPGPRATTDSWQSSEEEKRNRGHPRQGNAKMENLNVSSNKLSHPKEFGQTDSCALV